MLNVPRPEQILPALRQAKVPVRWTTLMVRHTGYVDPVLRARKLERDIRLLNLDLLDRPTARLGGRPVGAA